MQSTSQLWRSLLLLLFIEHILAIQRLTIYKYGISTNKIKSWWHRTGFPTRNFTLNRMQIKYILQLNTIECEKLMINVWAAVIQIPVSLLTVELFSLFLSLSLCLMTLPAPSFSFTANLLTDRRPGEPSVWARLHRIERCHCQDL